MTFAGSYNAVNGTGTTFTTGDTITGNGFGTGNSLNVKDVTGASAAGVPTGVTVSGVQTANITSTGTIGNATGTNGQAAVAQVDQLTSDPFTFSTPPFVDVDYGGVVVTLAFAGTETQAEVLQAEANAINALAGSAVATVAGTSIIVTAPVAGTALPDIVVLDPNMLSPLAQVVVENQVYIPAVDAAVYDVSGWTGLTAFNGTSVGGENVNAALTTNVSATDSNLGAGAIDITGGNNVTVAASKMTTGSIYVGGDVVAERPVGAVAITATLADNGGAGGLVYVDGGTTVSVTQSLTSNLTNANTVDQADVLVEGTALTTSVTVNQANTATSQAVQLAQSGVLYKGAVTAAPGVTGVTGITGQVYQTAKAESAAVTQGVVTITDKNGSSQTAAGTISSVTLNGFGTGSVITTNALTTLNVGGTTTTGATLAITDNLLSHAATGTTLALNTTSLVGAGSGVVSAGTISDTNGTIEVVNLTNSGVSSFTLSSAEVGTLAIGGAGSVTMPVNTTNLAGLTSLSLSGAVSFNDGSLSSAGSLSNTGLSGFGSALTISNTSSGNVTASINGSKQAYTGGAGNDTIVLTADATKAIVGGAGTDELVLSSAVTYTAVNTGRNVTGFETLGLVEGGAYTLDVAQLFSNTFTTLNVRGLDATSTLSNLAQNASISFQNTTTAALTVNYADKSGATDNVTVTIGSATNTAAKTVYGLQVQDANYAGIGTLNIVSNNLTQSSVTSTPGTNNTAGQNIITTLTDVGLANLNVSGTGDLLIGTAGSSGTYVNTAATALSINNTTTGTLGLEIAGIVDNSLASITFSGSNATKIDALSDTVAALTLSNSGTSSATVTAFSSSTLGSLTLNGNVTIGAAGVSTASLGTPWSLSKTTGITISGATSNSRANVDLGAAADGYTNTVTLGNGNNAIVDNTTAGDIVISVGTGANYIDIRDGGNNATYSATVTIAADTNTNVDVDRVIVSKNAAANVSAGVVETVITGMGAGDQMSFAGFTVATVKTLTAAEQATAASFSTALLAAEWVMDQVGTDNTAVSFLWNGNTYVVGVKSYAASDLTADDTVVELVGAHTLSTTLYDTGVIALAS